MPEGPFSFAMHRLDSRLDLRMRNPLLSGCLLRLSPDHDERVQLARNLIHHPVWFVLLRNHAFRYEERWCHLSTVHAAMLHRTNRPDHVEQPKPTIAVYVDDIVVNMAQACNLIVNLAVTFVNL